MAIHHHLQLTLKDCYDEEESKLVVVEVKAEVEEEEGLVVVVVAEGVVEELR